MLGAVRAQKSVTSKDAFAAFSRKTAPLHTQTRERYVLVTKELEGMVGMGSDLDVSSFVGMSEQEPSGVPTLPVKLIEYSRSPPLVMEIETVGDFLKALARLKRSRRRQRPPKGCDIYGFAEALQIAAEDSEHWRHATTTITVAAPDAAITECAVREPLLMSQVMAAGVRLKQLSNVFVLAFGANDDGNSLLRQVASSMELFYPIQDIWMGGELSTAQRRLQDVVMNTYFRGENMVNEILREPSSDNPSDPVEKPNTFMIDFIMFGSFLTIILITGAMTSVIYLSRVKRQRGLAKMKQGDYIQDDEDFSRYLAYHGFTRETYPGGDNFNKPDLDDEELKVKEGPEEETDCDPRLNLSDSSSTWASVQIAN